MKPSTPTVREATAADAPALARLRFEFRAPLGEVVEEEATFVARCAAWMAPRLAVGETWRAWLAEEDGDVVGTIWVGLIEKLPNPTPEPEEHAYVTNVYVRPSRRGAGVGSALLRAALAWCEGRGVHAVVLWPTARSAPLYRRHGFAPPAALLELELTRGPARVVPGHE
jgi:GNAT superfamily N-acetyltransferase